MCGDLAGLETLSACHFVHSKESDMRRIMQEKSDENRQTSGQSEKEWEIRVSG